MTYYFDRYRDGRKMAQGVRVDKAKSFESACEIASRLSYSAGFRLGDILVVNHIVYGDENDGL